GYVKWNRFRFRLEVELHGARRRLSDRRREVPELDRPPRRRRGRRRRRGGRARPRRALVSEHPFLERSQCQAGDGFEGLEDSLAENGAGFLALVPPFQIQALFELVCGEDVGEVAFVVLKDERQIFELESDLG